jgi:vacuolar-type H+-ATPase subunit E/Vma4
MDANDQKVLKKIELETNQDIDAIKQSFDKEIIQYKDSELKKTQDKINNEKQKQEIDLDLYKRKSILNVKRNILDSVFVDFIYKLKNWNEKQYLSYIFKSIDKLTNLKKNSKIFIGKGFLSLNSNSSSNSQNDFENNIKNYILKKSNFNENGVSIIFTTDIDFGVIYSEENLTIDLSLEVIIKDLKLKNEIELSNILFEQK